MEPTNWAAVFKFFQPGLHIKRWMLLSMLGLIFVSLGIAYLFVHLYRAQPLPELAAPLTLQFIDRPIRGGIFLVLGLGAMGLGLFKLNETFAGAFVRRGRGSLLEEIFSTQARDRGPKIVVIGGGTGLSVALRGLKEHTSHLTAIVTVADDGGSSGRLRRDLGVLPPGDFRNCLVALADVEPLMETLFQYRFNSGSPELDGHSFGNLFIVAMSEVTGNFERALQEASRVLAVRGQVVPSTLGDLTLCAELGDEVVQGETKVSASTRPIQRVFLQPDNPPAYPEAVKAIHEADLVVVGPGSLFTSVLPNLLVRGIADALQTSQAVKVYVCNVATQPGETDGFGISDHIAALLRHLPHGENPFDYVVVNDHIGLPMPASGKVAPVAPDARGLNGRLIVADVVDESNAVRHDATKLAQVLVRLAARQPSTPL
ncbi:MAG: YvcK family protein [Chloroflexi bacterium]|nr:YvcK family protein [Chloroflexota bacterium]